MINKKDIKACVLCDQKIPTFFYHFKCEKCGLIHWFEASNNSACQSVNFSYKDYLFSFSNIKLKTSNSHIKFIDLNFEYFNSFKKHYKNNSIEKFINLIHLLK